MGGKINARVENAFELLERPFVTGRARSAVHSGYVERRCFHGKTPYARAGYRCLFAHRADFLAKRVEPDGADHDV